MNTKTWVVGIVVYTVLEKVAGLIIIPLLLKDVPPDQEIPDFVAWLPLALRAIFVGIAAACAALCVPIGKQDEGLVGLKLGGALLAYHLVFMAMALRDGGFEDFSVVRTVFFAIAFLLASYLGGLSTKMARRPRTH